MSKSEENLAAAFAGESQANRKYLFFAEKAVTEGQPQVARLFRAAAAAETVHARNHLRALKGIKSTVENLQAASGGEYHEFTSMYPGFIAAAQAEGAEAANRSFDFANQVEAIHHGLFERTIADVKGGKAIAEVAIYVCQVCGNTVEGSVPGKCPVCNAPAKQFLKID